MKHLGHRLEALEEQRCLQLAAEAAPPGFSAHDITEEAMRFFELPEDEQIQRLHVRPEERAELDCLRATIQRVHRRRGHERY